jgi:hypothetical protein
MVYAHKLQDSDHVQVIMIHCNDVHERHDGQCLIKRSTLALARSTYCKRRFGWYSAINATATMGKTFEMGVKGANPRKSSDLSTPLAERPKSSPREGRRGIVGTDQHQFQRSDLGSLAICHTESLKQATKQATTALIKNKHAGVSHTPRAIIFFQFKCNFSRGRPLLSSHHQRFPPLSITQAPIDTP